MRVLVVAEARDGEITSGSLGLASLGSVISGDDTVGAVVWGAASSQARDSLAGYGIDEVFLDEAGLSQPALAQQMVDAVSTVFDAFEPEVILLESSALTADAAAGLAARLGAGVNWDLTHLDVVESELVGTRLVAGDTLSVEVGWVGTPQIAVMRPGASKPTKHGGAGRLKTFSSQLRPYSTLVSLATLDPSEPEKSVGPSIEETQVVVAGGRGMRDQAALSDLEGLAAELNASVGVSMPIVDLGWYPYSNQVGQTGKRISPKVYLACGISGALQHRVGMQNAEHVIAINSDATAPIFDMCDFGVVGDLHEIIPQLTLLLQSEASEVT